MDNRTVTVKWLDSYGIETGWQDISSYKANLLVITSWGKVVYEDNDVMALAHNYAQETDNTPMQANGIMVIPKICIIETTEICADDSTEYINPASLKTIQAILDLEP